MRLSIQYYDLILLGILCSLLLGVVAAPVTGLSSAITVPAAAVIGVALIYHTLFVRGSIDTAAELSEEAAEVELLE